MHLPQIRILVEHLNQDAWAESPSCHGERSACRLRPPEILNARCAEPLQSILTAFVKVWQERGGKNISARLC